MDPANPFYPYRHASPEKIETAIHRLHTKRIIFDEEDMGLGSKTIQDNPSGLMAFLVERGYLGGELKSTGEFYGDHGSIYALYDSGQLGDSEARKRLDEFHVKQVVKFGDSLTTGDDDQRDT